MYDILSVDEGGQVLSRDNFKTIDIFLEIIGSVTEMKGMALEEMLKHDPYVILSEIVSHVFSRP